MPRKTLEYRIAPFGWREASMRPRPDAAENRGFLFRGKLGLAASMRPRPDAAENPPQTSGT